MVARRELSKMNVSQRVLNSIYGLFFSALSIPVVAMNLSLPENASGPVQNFQIIPYAFSNANTGPAAAAALVASGYVQPQMVFVGNAFASTNGSSNLFLTALDYQVPGIDRLFIDTKFMYADWGEADSYQNGNPAFPNGGAGTNDSDKDNFVTVEGDDLQYRIKLKYLLPIGNGEEEPIHTFRVRNGMLVPGSEAGGGAFNPFASGRTTIDLEWFFRDQDVKDDDENNYTNITSGLKFGLDYDNTDWFSNPSRGTRTRLTFARDWGAERDSRTWSSVQLQHSAYFSLPHGENVRQRILALDFWYSDVPTWNSSHTIDGKKIFHRAPLYEGSSIGGLDRQRGFAQDRFHDRSAINYAVEFRQMPANNPFMRIPLVNKLNIPWWQWVVFAEAGRVAEKPAFSTLHEDMKFSAGAGVRLLVEGLVIRLDVAGSEEGSEVQMFFSHTF
jgi:hypothetical protein